MEDPLISVIVPTYNRCEMLADALRSLFRQETGGEFSYEIVVVDNGSTDATRTIVEEAASESPAPVRYVHHDVPGDAPSRNRGIAEAQGTWMAFFDDDQLAAPDWLRQLRHAALATGAAVVGGAVHLDLPADVLRRFGPYVRRHAFRETVDCPTLRLMAGKEVPGCGNALVARRVFQSVGTFDASIAWGGSDGDFFLRAKAAGEAVYYSPQAVIRHRIPSARLTPDSFHWDAYRGGNYAASGDWSLKGPLAIAFRFLARIAQSLLVLFPGLAWAALTKDAGGVLDHKARLWRNEGYLRRVLALMAPKWFPQEEYFRCLTLHFGRAIVAGTEKVETAS